MAERVEVAIATRDGMRCCHLNLKKIPHCLWSSRFTFWAGTSPLQPHPSDVHRLLLRLGQTHPNPTAAVTKPGAKAHRRSPSAC